MKLSTRAWALGAASTLLMSSASFAAGTWSSFSGNVPFAAGAAFLMRDGTVLIHDDFNNPSNWYKLTPDAKGNYATGTITQIASLPSGYAPTYFGSAVLPDGRLIVDGGEYNNGQSKWTNLSAIYDPTKNTWASVAPPSGWANIGDASGLILSDGTYMLANTITTAAALLNAQTLTWTATGAGKADRNDEEGWTLLPNKLVLAVDASNSVNGTQHSELYSEKTGKWTAGPIAPEQLVDSQSEELGPQMLMPNGLTLCEGATPHNALYDYKKNTFTKAPDFPVVGGSQQDAADAPSALLVNGNVLAATSPGIFGNGVQILEFNYKTSKWSQGPAYPDAANISSFEVKFLPLPNGQVLADDAQDNAIEFYTPSGSPDPKWAPHDIQIASSLTRGSSYTLTGKLLSGISEANAYGDDYSAQTNYPLVRITNTKSGDVQYATALNPSSDAVHNKKATTVQVTIPANAETGAATLQVVTNGIASTAVNVTIQ